MTLTKPLTKKQRQWLRLFDKLNERLTMPLDDFRSLGTVTETRDGPLIYIDRGSPVLGVAHLDTVCKGKPPKPKWLNGPDDFPIVNSIALDDRLGAWMLLDLLPSIGLTFDVLLCDGEERGRSTAEHFQPTRQYNWGFEFDRAGVDTVLYDYEDSEEWISTLEEHGFLISSGTFSDISSLTSLGCCFANFGVGYHYQHTPHCYANLCDTHYMASLFVDFFQSNMKKKFAFEKPAVERRDVWYSTALSYNKSGRWLVKNDQERCQQCGAYLDFYGSCERCDWQHEDKQVTICPWCDCVDRRDEDGVCTNCGYDSIIDSNW